MGIIEYIERTRMRPKAERSRITFFAAGGMTIVIFAVWLTVIFPNGYRETMAKSASDPESVSNTMKQFTEDYRNAREQFSVIAGESQQAAVASAGADASATTTVGGWQPPADWQPVQDGTPSYDFGY